MAAGAGGRIVARVRASPRTSPFLRPEVPGPPGPWGAALLSLLALSGSVGGGGERSAVTRGGGGAPLRRGDPSLPAGGGHGGHGLRD